MNFYLYVRVPHTCQVLSEAKESIQSLGNTVISSCEPLCWCWEPNLGSLEEQQILLNMRHLFRPNLPFFF